MVPNLITMEVTNDAPKEWEKWTKTFFYEIGTVSEIVIVAHSCNRGRGKSDQALALSRCGRQPLRSSVNLEVILSCGKR